MKQHLLETDGPLATSIRLLLTDSADATCDVIQTDDPQGRPLKLGFLVFRLPQLRDDLFDQVASAIVFLMEEGHLVEPNDGDASAPGCRAGDSNTQPTDHSTPPPHTTRKNIPRGRNQ